HRVAEHLVAVVDEVRRGERAAAVLARIDDEVDPTEPPRDPLTVGELLRGPVEVGRIEDEALGVLDAGLQKVAGVLTPPVGIGGATVEVDDEVWILLEDLDRG